MLKVIKIKIVAKWKVALLILTGLYLALLSLSQPKIDHFYFQRHIGIQFVSCRSFDTRNLSVDNKYSDLIYNLANIFKSCAMILNIISNTASYSVYRVMYTGCHVPPS